MTIYIKSSFQSDDINELINVYNTIKPIPHNVIIVAENNLIDARKVTELMQKGFNAFTDVDNNLCFKK